MTKNEREIGRVISVSNYRVRVLLDPDLKSQVRAYPHRIALVTQIGSYVLFPTAPGENAVGIIVGASEDEAVEPDEGKGMTLQLVRSRRILTINLLGKLHEKFRFKTGITVYPTLETPALLPTEKELMAILEYQPDDEQKDSRLIIGSSPVYTQQLVMASFNDLLARPLGIVGNTGSGKSCSVASIIQSALAILKSNGEAGLRKGPNYTLPKFIILDINGEYASAFPSMFQGCSDMNQKELNKVYVNGKPFELPLWTFNLTELIRFFDASQASQQPALERVVTMIREDSIDKEDKQRQLRRIVRIIDECQSYLNKLTTYIEAPTDAHVGKKTKQLYNHLIPRIEEIISYETLCDCGIFTHECDILNDYLLDLEDINDDHNIPFQTTNKIRNRIMDLGPKLDTLRDCIITKGGIHDITADTPIPFDTQMLLKDDYFSFAISRLRGQERIQEYIATLRQRIHRQLADKRWSVFTARGGKFSDIITTMTGDSCYPVVVVDCSMLAHDVLPFFCAVFGRLLLELRSHADPAKRIIQPYVLVLEEAHNYLKPSRADEASGLSLARETFERIAKEGRKFGLSLIVASQRPSDVSATVLSQCANFLIHRIQNPEDIDYFKKILPLGSRDLLDQLPILVPGDGLLIGSAVNVPARVKVRKPNPNPLSETSKPWQAWQPGQEQFDIERAVYHWAFEDKYENGSEQKAEREVAATLDIGDLDEEDIAEFLSEDDLPF